MSWLTHILGLIPIAVDVAGRKSRLVLKLGDFLVGPSGLKQISLAGKKVDIPEESLLRLWAYAGKNVGRTYRSSDLGRYMQRVIKPDSVFIDVGANIGGYSLLAGEMGAQVHAVEAHPEIARGLQAIEPAIGTVHACALSDSTGEMDFHISEINPGGSSLVSSQKGWEASGYSASVKVQVETFDELFHHFRQDGKVIDLVKIDVEGAEAHVVGGMQRSLKSGIIRSIWCEVRGPLSDRNPNSYREVIDLLLPYGFQAYTFDSRQTGEGALLPFLDAEQPVPQYFDLLFVADGSSRSTGSS